MENEKLAENEKQLENDYVESSKNDLLNRSQQNLAYPKPRPLSNNAIPNLIKKGTAYEIKKTHNINYDKKIVNYINAA